MNGEWPSYDQQVLNTAGWLRKNLLVPCVFLLKNFVSSYPYILVHYHLWQSCVGRFRDVEMWTAGSLGWGHHHRPQPHTWPGVTYSTSLPLIGQSPPILASDWLTLSGLGWCWLPRLRSGQIFTAPEMITFMSVRIVRDHLEQLISLISDTGGHRSGDQGTRHQGGAGMKGLIGAPRFRLLYSFWHDWQF